MPGSVAGSRLEFIAGMDKKEAENTKTGLAISQTRSQGSLETPRAPTPRAACPRACLYLPLSLDARNGVSLGEGSLSMDPPVYLVCNPGEPSISKMGMRFTFTHPGAIV